MASLVRDRQNLAVAMEAPETRYARSGDYSIAYQVVGEGELDLVYVPGLASHLEVFWEEPAYSRFLYRLASFSRLILMDRLGTGLSDRLPAGKAATFEQRMDDIRAVMDAVGSGARRRARMVRGSGAVRHLRGNLSAADHRARHVRGNAPACQGR